MQFQLQDSEWWPPNKLLAHQLRQVQNVIDHAQATVPFYKERLAPFAGWPPGALSLERFRDIPVLRREEVQAASNSMHARRLPPGHEPTFAIRTSGSSGRPVEALGTQLTGIMNLALSQRGHLWHGRDVSLKSVSIRRPRPSDHVRGRNRWTPLHHGGPAVAIDLKLHTSEMFEQILREDPAYLECHAPLMVGLAQRTVETGLRPKALREVRNLGQPLDPWIRAYCTKVWDVPIIDNYGAEEIGTIAHQCPESENLHVQGENVLVEVLDDQGKPCTPGQSGRIVVTSLPNFATPLIRYELGDVVEVGGRCPCGRGLPVLTRIRGRTQNLLHLPNGDTLFPSIWKEIMSFPKIRQFQMTQTSLQDVVLKLVVSDPLDDAERKGLVRGIQDRLTADFRVGITYVDDIPRQPGGKFLEFKSELADPPTAAPLPRSS
jgi:phenylacetate-CoA ligase